MDPTNSGFSYSVTHMKCHHGVDIALELQEPKKRHLEMTVICCFLFHLTYILFKKSKIISAHSSLALILLIEHSYAEHNTCELSP